MNIIVVGIGLIGGSICKALKKNTEHHVIGLDRDTQSLNMAVATEAIDEVIYEDQPELLNKGDLVVVCIPPKATVDFVLRNKDYFKKGAIVTDVCGVKRYIVNAVEEPLREIGVEFIGAHPMAGTEFSGFLYSKDNLFVNASYLLTPTSMTDRGKLEILRNFGKELGFRTVLETTPENHDASIAYTSQLAHVVSNSYIKSPTLAKEKGFSFGSFQDMTRVARLDEDMWCDLFLLNKDNLLFEVDTLIAHINEHREALIAGDRERIRMMLRKGRLLKEANADIRKS